jgi:hypothetical protein
MATTRDLDALALELPEVTKDLSDVDEVAKARLAGE